MFERGLGSLSAFSGSRKHLWAKPGPRRRVKGCKKERSFFFPEIQVQQPFSETSMRFKRSSWAALAAACALVACGGGASSDVTPKTTFSGLVSFGDSLSDAGAYNVGTVAALRGGRYTINSAAATPTPLWVDFLAASIGASAPCAAQTGLNSRAPFGAPVASVTTAACTNYAQGGSRVTNPIGPANAALPDAAGGAVGQLTVPVITQINNHLAKVGGSFRGTEMVTVLAGGNDVFMNLATIAPTAEAMIRAGVPAAKAQQDAATAAVTAMGTAGAELAAYIKNLIVGKGAKTVVVLALPDVGSTPFGIENGPDTKALASLMASTFNDQLTKGLAGVQGVVFADTFTESRNQFNNPAQYGLTNTTKRACDRTPAKNPLGGASIVCNVGNVIAEDVSKFAFSDDVHPSPIGHRLIYQFVAVQLGKAGLL
jgi:outer membrane lipase/esterase